MASIFDTNISPQNISMLRGAGSNSATNALGGISATNALGGISDLVQNRRTREDRKVIQEQALAQQALQNERQARLDALNAENVRSSIAARAATQARADKEYNRLLTKEKQAELDRKNTLKFQEQLAMGKPKTIHSITPEELAKEAGLWDDIVMKSTISDYAPEETEKSLSDFPSLKLQDSLPVGTVNSLQYEDLEGVLPTNSERAKSLKSLFNSPTPKTGLEPWNARTVTGKTEDDMKTMSKDQAESAQRTLENIAKSSGREEYESERAARIIRELKAKGVEPTLDMFKYKQTLDLAEQDKVKTLSTTYSKALDAASKNLNKIDEKLHKIKDKVKSNNYIPKTNITSQEDINEVISTVSFINPFGDSSTAKTIGNHARSKGIPGDVYKAIVNSMMDSSMFGTSIEYNKDAIKDFTTKGQELGLLDANGDAKTDKKNPGKGLLGFYAKQREEAASKINEVNNKILSLEELTPQERKKRTLQLLTNSDAMSTLAGLPTNKRLKEKEAILEEQEANKAVTNTKEQRFRDRTVPQKMLGVTSNPLGNSNKKKVTPPLTITIEGYGNFEFPTSIKSLDQRVREVDKEFPESSRARREAQASKINEYYRDLKDYVGAYYSSKRTPNTPVPARVKEAEEELESRFGYKKERDRDRLINDALGTLDALGSLGQVSRAPGNLLSKLLKTGTVNMNQKHGAALLRAWGRDVEKYNKLNTPFALAPAGPEGLLSNKAVDALKQQILRNTTSTGRAKAGKKDIVKELKDILKEHENIRAR